MSSSISLLQLPRLCIWTSQGKEDGRVISGVGPHLEVYSLQRASGAYRLLSRTTVFGHCGRPVMGVRRIAGSDAFVVTGSSLLCILKEEELMDAAFPSSRIHSFSDEIVTIAYAEWKETQYEFALVLRSGRTLRVTASVDAAANRLRVDPPVAEYDGAKCGLLMSALCLLPAGPVKQWDEMRCVAGSGMGEVRLWGTDGASSSTTECGRIGFVISMAVVDEGDDAREGGAATVIAVTENRAINLWRIRYREPDWLQLLQKEEAAHSVRPSAVAYCSRTRTAVSAAEDGELCVWAMGDARFSLLRRFQTRGGAVRSLSVDGEGRILYGSVSGSLLALPLDILMAEPERRFIEGSNLREYFRDIAPGTRLTELQCLGEDGSAMEVTGERAAEWVDNEGSFLYLTSWTDGDSAITVFHNDTLLRMSSYHPPDHRVYDTGYTVLSDSARRSAILAAIPTMSRSKEGAEPYLVVQSTDGEIALIRECFGVVRAWRYRIRDEEAYGSPVQGAGKRRRRNQMLIVNAVAIDRSDDTALHVILGTTNGRILYAPVRGEGEQVPEGESVLDFALDKDLAGEGMIMYPRSARLAKTSITQLEYCRRRGECTALSKNGWMLRMRVVDGVLSVAEEDVSRELGVEWPVRLERRGEEEYVIGFNGRNLVVVSRRGHRQVHVDLYGSEEREEGYGSLEYGSEEGGVERITVYYVQNQGIIRHSQRALTAGMRQLAWTPHRDKIVFCTGVDRYLLTGSIDGEIVLGSRDYDSLSVRQRWYVPETTVACVARPDKHTLRIVIGGPRGELYVVEWSEEEEEEGRNPPLTAVATGNDSRAISVSALGDYIVAAFADAQIAIFRLDSATQRWKRVTAWEMPTEYRSAFTMVCAHLSPAHAGTILIDAITTAGTLTRLSFDEVDGKISHLRDVSIDRAALTVIRRDPEAGITVVGSDSGALFVYKDSEQSLELQEVWRDAHTCQITDVALFRSPSGALRVASVGMDCTITVLELEMGGAKLSLVRSAVFAVNDPASIVVWSEPSGNQRAIVAGCGLEIVDL
ncbi:hypothetical protein PRIPAC_72229 [Pristionchus pacificus]|uniref:tRNA (34-2'-O)-methyltransferase regulator WDR6 n=1 Tax=Pristionchus pacificus TaxID=54126 RepID=A0A2A6C6E3_PRIPA|nr:hypothetical protein PRIPAC_72229 [Pristionchus pacificus]|eukprot:PDM73734.1 hypothetical protein PRIPAC_41090 [Pristionchus pacificus]